MMARSKERMQGRSGAIWLPQIGFGLQYSRLTSVLNNINQDFYNNRASPNNLSSGFSINIPLFESRAAR